MSEELEVLMLLTERLQGAGFNYMISGSMATNYYSIPRMTRDIDVVIELEDLNIEKFINLFEKDFYLDRQSLKSEVNRNGMFNLIHNAYAIKIDFILRKKTEFQSSTFNRKRQIQINDQAMWIMSPEDLCLMKMLWAKDSFSETQLNDVRGILENVETLEQKYIDDWVNKLGLQGVYRKIKHE